VGVLKNLASNNEYHSLQHFSENPIVKLMADSAFKLGGHIKDRSLLQVVLNKDLNIQQITLAGFMFAVVHLVAKNALVELTNLNKIPLNEALKIKFKQVLGQQVDSISAMFSMLSVQKSQQSWHIDNALINLSSVNGDKQGTLIVPKNQVLSFLESLKASYLQNKNMPAHYADISKQVKSIANQLKNPDLSKINKNKLYNHLFQVLMAKSFEINFELGKINCNNLQIQALPANTVNLYFARGILTYLDKVLRTTRGDFNINDLPFGSPAQPLIHSSPTLFTAHPLRTVSSFNLNYM
jgi:hypothetical protein